MTAKARISAINRFVSGCKADGIYNDLKAACVMAGWDSLAGALTPLVGASPTNSGFLDADLDRGLGVSGDAANHIGTNRPGSADGQDDCHLSVFASSPATNATTGGRAYIGVGGNTAGAKNIVSRYVSPLEMTFRVNNAVGQEDGANNAVGFIGASRSSPTAIQGRASKADYPFTASSDGTDSNDLHVFATNWTTTQLASDATLSFYSVGSATDLALLDARVSQLMADLRAIEEDGFDADAVAYIRNVETADSAYLETSVKTAINRLVVGLKKDGLWEPMKASCLLCGPRTLAGALVPLRGGLPLAYNFASGDYSRVGLRGNGTNTFINASYLNSASPRDNIHYGVYQSTPATTGVLMGSGGAGSGANSLWEQNLIRTRCQSANIQDGTTLGSIPSFLGMRRNNSAFYDVRYGGVSDQHADASSEPGDTITTVFARGTSGGGRDSVSDATISFYSIGTSLSLEDLDTHVSNYVTAIGASV